MINVLNIDDLIGKRFELEFLMNNEEAPEEEREKAYERLKKHDRIMKSMEKIILK